MEHGNLYGLEATPAESATFRFARLDRERFSGIRTAGHEGETLVYQRWKLPADYDGFTLQECTHKPGFTASLLPQALYSMCIWAGTGGLEKARDLLSSMITGAPYSLFTCLLFIPSARPALSARQTGEVSKCNGCSVYSRIAGYYRTCHDWNDGKAQEFRNRIMFRIE